jgi:hypothetical protein
VDEWCIQGSSSELYGALTGILTISAEAEAEAEARGPASRTGDKTLVSFNVRSLSAIELSTESSISILRYDITLLFVDFQCKKNR